MRRGWSDGEKPMGAERRGVDDVPRLMPRIRAESLRLGEIYGETKWYYSK